MKRIISVLSIFFLLIVIPFCGAAAETQVHETSKCQAARFLEYMQILPEKADAIYTQTVSRSDFAVALASLLKLNGEAYENVRYFSDIASYDYAVGSINALVETGIISVADDHIFNPERGITLNEAVKMLVCALGYSPMAEAKGGCTRGYAYVADRIELTDNVSCDFEKNINLNNAAQLLFNGLISPVYTVSGISENKGNTDYSYYESDANSILYILYGMRVTQGIMTGSNGINISTDKTGYLNNAVIDGITYDLRDGTEFIDLIGCDVCGIYDADTNELIYAFPKPVGRSEIKVIDIKDFVSYTDKELCYTESDKNSVKKLNITGALLLYNGAVPEEKISELISKDNLINGTVRLIDVEDNGSWDAVMVENYESFLFKYVDSVNEILYCLTNNTSINLADCDYVSVTDETGAEAAIEDIAPKTVLNVARTQNNARVKIIISKATAEGVISAVNTKDGETVVSIDNDEYRISSQHSNRINSSVVIGKNVVAYLDMFGRIVEIEAVSPDGYSVAYIIKAREVSGGFSNRMGLYAYTSDGELKVLNCAENLKVDGMTYRDKNLDAILAIPTAAGSASTVKFTPQIIRYKTNDKGEITVIDTYNPGVENQSETLMRTLDGTSSIMKFADRLGKTELISAANTKVYHVPVDEDAPNAEKSEFLITGINRINSRYSFKLEAYKLRGDNEYIDVIVYRRTPTDTEENDWWNSNMFLVSEISNMIDEEGTYFYRISGMVNGAGTSIDVYQEELPADSVKIEDINEGDLIRYRTNIHGKIHDIEKLYDPEGYDFVNWKNYGTTTSLFDNTYDQYFQLSFGFVSEKNANSLGWSYWIHDCDFVTIDKIRIDAKLDYPNNDGVHINSSRIVTVSNCLISCGDDCIIVRANNSSLKENKVCEKVTVTNCSLTSHSGGIRVGWIKDGTIRNCTFSNIVMTDTTVGISIYLPERKGEKRWADEGREYTLIENLSFNNIVMDRAYSYPVYIHVDDCSESWCDAVRNIYFSGVNCRGLELPYAKGTKVAPLKNIVFSDSRFEKLKREGNDDNKHHGAIMYGKKEEYRSVFIKNAEVIFNNVSFVTEE